MAPNNEITLEISKPFLTTPSSYEVVADDRITQLRVRLPSGCTAQPAIGKQPTTLKIDTGGGYLFAITVPTGDAAVDYTLLLSDETGQTGPGTIRVRPKGKPSILSEED
jgi:hypothetical protein